MTYYSSKELAAGFRTARRNTIHMAEDIPETQYAFRAAPETRTVGELLVHIAHLHIFQHRVHLRGFDDMSNVSFPDLAEEVAPDIAGALRHHAAHHGLPGSSAVEVTWTLLEALPRSKAEIIGLLTVEGETFASYLDGLSDSFLAERVRMPGPDAVMKSRFEMLMSVKEHEMHHRGQLSVMQRLIGITPHLTRQKQEMMAFALRRARR